MFIYDWFREKGRQKKRIVKFLRIMSAESKDRTSEIKRILTIARRLGFDQNEIEKVIVEVNMNMNMNMNMKKVILPADEDSRFNVLYDFVGLILEADDFMEELDLCVEMAVVLEFRYYDAPTVVREIFNGRILGTSEKLIKEKVATMIKKPRINFNNPGKP